MWSMAKLVSDERGFVSLAVKYSEGQLRCLDPADSKLS